MSKRRYNAKKIARTPSLKRDLAMFIAEHRKVEVPSLIEMVAYGHRGLISYDEAELCKMFDQLYQLKLEIIEKYQSEINYLSKAVGNKHWKLENIKGELAILNKELAKYEEMASKIFEEKVLK